MICEESSPLYVHMEEAEFEPIESGPRMITRQGLVIGILSFFFYSISKGTEQITKL